MKKVGIITITDNDNYGNRLQNYALQEVIKSYRFDVETIKNNSLFNNKLNGVHKIVALIKNIKRNFELQIKRKTKIKKRYKSFCEFNSNIQTTKQSFSHKKNNNKYDYLIIGSDQVWNPTFGRLSDFELGNFNTTATKISYAASFGISQLPETYKTKAKNAFKEFNNISVREDAGKNIVEELTDRKDVQVLIDPTMMLTSDEWNKVSKRPTQLEEGKRYILNYFLGELSVERKNEIERIAKENSCEVINILDKKSPFYQTGPSEFLYLEKNAFLICTDSFHSCVFAMLYNRPFVIFDREENVVSMNSRIDTLLSKFNLKNRKFNKTITKENLNHDYTEAYRILEEERKKSIQFLETALNIKE